MEAIYNLSESHSPELRLKTVSNYENLHTNINKRTPQISSKEALIMKCPLESDQNKMYDMLRYVEEMPEGIIPICNNSIFSSNNLCSFLQLYYYYLFKHLIPITMHPHLLIVSIPFLFINFTKQTKKT